MGEHQRDNDRAAHYEQYEVPALVTHIRNRRIGPRQEQGPEGRHTAEVLLPYFLMHQFDGTSGGVMPVTSRVERHIGKGPFSADIFSILSHQSHATAPSFLHFFDHSGSI